MKKALYEILVPTFFGTNPKIIINTIKVWENELLLISRGLTKLPVVDGVWINEGKEYFYKNTPYRVCVTLEELNALLKLAKTLFNQITIMAYKISDDVIFYN